MQARIDVSQALTQGFFELWRVPTRRTVTQWADDKRILPSKGSAEPGKYRSARTPYMREIQDCLSSLSPVEEVALQAAAQTGKSEAGNNWVGYVIDEAPGPMLVVQPTVDNAKRYSKQRISPMIHETPSLRDKVAANRSRAGGNTLLEKEVPGGIILLGGANSAAGLRSMPIRYLFADEVSNWPDDVDGEGDPLELAQERTNTFGRKRKLFKCSTPGVRDFCRIEAEEKKTDGRRYHVPCPHCGCMHQLLWANFRIPKDNDGKPIHRRAHMVCPDCGGVVEERHKTDMLSGGKWTVTRPENLDHSRRGYQISALYSPVGWKSWARISRQWSEAQGNPTKLKAFVNNVLAETWEEEYSARLDGDAVAKRAEFYDLLTVPEGGLVVLAGIDVQPNRLEVVQRAFGVGEESWLVNYTVIHGDPSAGEVWAQLLNVLDMEFRHASGARLTTYAACVDSGDGNLVNEVYLFARQHRARHVLAIKGISGARPAIGAPTKQDINLRGQKMKRGALMYPVGVDGIKSTIYGRLKRAEPGPGCMHFPVGLPTEFYAQLTAERQVVKFTRGMPKRVWTKKDGDRNEALDCEVYAYAGLHFAYSRHNRATFWKQMAERLGKAVRVEADADPQADDDPQPAPTKSAVTDGRISLAGWKRGR